MSIKPIIERDKITDDFIHENPVLNRVFQNRGISSKQDIDYPLSRLLPPSLMKGMDEGTDLLIHHILSDSKILIIGDFDCDGATATSTAVEGLTMLGAKHVSFLIPNREKHGYGLTPEIVKLAESFEPDLIVTVDNGIASLEGASAVKNMSRPCQLLITDHHLQGTMGLPEADGIINPNQEGCKFPSKAICGCGVMFYTIAATRTKMREQGIFNRMGIKEPSLSPLLDLVALGTIADVVGLDYNNRLLVTWGLHRINSGYGRPGITSILEKKKKTIGDIVSSDFGFAAGPCLNAAGRLEDMSKGIKCLLTNDPEEANRISTELFELNEKRKEISSEMEVEAFSTMDKMSIPDKQFGITIHDGFWHEGVIGILASRIKEKYNRPVIVFTDTHEAREVRKLLDEAIALDSPIETIERIRADLDSCYMKGSGRSVPGVHLRHVLDEINKRHPECLNKFGGHAMAAGATLKIGEFRKFQELFDEVVRKDLTVDMINGKIEVDIKDIDPDLMTMETAELINKSGPWGQHFEEPVFSQTFIPVSQRILGGKHLKLTVKAVGSDKEFEAICFNCIENDELPYINSFEASFSLDINKWRGNSSLQLMFKLIQDKEMDLKKEFISDMRGDHPRPSDKNNQTFSHDPMTIDF
jgi:single-stranded-DNA-specific exonuclease